MAPSRTRQQLLVLLRERGAMSRAELARASGLSTSTVSTAIAEMAASGVVVEGGDAVRPAGRGAGRPGRAVALNPRAGAAVGIYLGFRHVRVVVADLAHRVLGSAVRELPEHTAERGLPAAVGAVEEALRSGSVYRDRLLGAGVGMPGPIHRRTGTPSPSNILPGWAGVHVAEELAERLGVPVAVDNESNLEALAELIWGAGSGATDLLYLKLHSGVGAGVVVNGQLARGAAGGAGEVGHTILDPAGPECSCGNRGCLQTYTSIGAVLAAAGRDSGREPSLRELLDAAGAGDPAVTRVLARAGERVGATMAGVCNALNPRRVVVGGALAQAGEVLIGPLRNALRARSLPLVGSNTEVVAGALGMQAGALGGVALVLREGERLVPAGPGPQRPRSS
jgi:predicted NBD/HSP70 family sugar kinase